MSALIAGIVVAVGGGIIVLAFYMMFLSPVEGAVIVKPVFTMSAYQQGGFYDYYRGDCDEKCLTVRVNGEYRFVGRGDWDSPDNLINYVGSQNAYQTLHMLGIKKVVTDLDVERDPSILSKYKTVIVLHSEYVTKKEFDAITSHKNVIYLYPNALYAEVSYDSARNSITLVKGHNYPSPEIVNGFGWKHENTPEEYDLECKTWQFRNVDNGVQLNCNPDQKILTDYGMWQKIRERT